MNWDEQFKLPVLVSGIVGGIISLTFEQKISFLKAIVMIFTGGSTAALTYPALEVYFSLQPQFANAVGFLLGLISMRVIDILLILLDRIKSNPALLLHLFNPAKYGDLLSNNKRDLPTGDDVDNSVHTTSDTTQPSEKNDRIETDIPAL